MVHTVRGEFRTNLKKKFISFSKTETKHWSQKLFNKIKKSNSKKQKIICSVFNKPLPTLPFDC